jgi:hypothetical protein
VDVAGFLLSTTFVSFFAALSFFVGGFTFAVFTAGVCAYREPAKATNATNDNIFFIANYFV